MNNTLPKYHKTIIPLIAKYEAYEIVPYANTVWLETTDIIEKGTIISILNFTSTLQPYYNMAIGAYDITIIAKVITGPYKGKEITIKQRGKLTNFVEEVVNSQTIEILYG